MYWVLDLCQAECDYLGYLGQQDTISDHKKHIVKKRDRQANS